MKRPLGRYCLSVSRLKVFGFARRVKRDADAVIDVGAQVKIVEGLLVY